MVAGKVKKVGLQRSPSRPPENDAPAVKPPSPSSGKGMSKGSAFSRSFGVYFPRCSAAQVQPRLPNVSELLRVVEELRERESRLKTEILEHKLLKETAAIVPVLENEISAKSSEVESFSKRVDSLEAENSVLKAEYSVLKAELDALRAKSEEEREESETRAKVMAAEIEELKKAIAERDAKGASEDCDELLLSSSSSSQRFQGLIDASIRSNLIKIIKNKGGAKCTDTAPNHENQKVRDDGEPERPRHSRCNSEEIAESENSVLVRSRIPRVPKPPPRPSSETEGSVAVPHPPPLVKLVPAPPPPPPSSKAAPPPPPPPPAAKGLRPVPAKVRRVPEVVEFYHSLMRRDSSRKDSAGVVDAPPSTASTRDMIGEIENRSAYLLAIKTDVETQGEFIRFLIKEIENAAFTDIEDVVPFVKWLDDELSYLVDERAVLKHFEWPEQKADALREAAFGYCDLKKLESEALSFSDDARQPCGPALKKMQALFEKLEHGVYNLSRLRESATNRYKIFKIPTNWMLDAGFVSQIKLASVKLSMKYMRRVSAELETGGSPEDEELIVQAVRFAFRVHQFAGGFDVETMRAFQELREKARSCHLQYQNQQHQKLLCRQMSC